MKELVPAVGVPCARVRVGTPPGWDSRWRWRRWRTGDPWIDKHTSLQVWMGLWRVLVDEWM
eukprot:scaffold310_cov335-Pavlova_lutheri.AAC.45